MRTTSAVARRVCGVGPSLGLILTLLSMHAPALFSAETAPVLTSDGFVTVGDPGNAASDEGLGAVGYEFQISAHEITNSEYAEFLNAVAQASDPYDLYSPLMSEHFWGGIETVVAEDEVRYQVKTGYERFPVTFVTWWDCARYCNWLHFGKPADVPCVVGTTEGNGDQGAYNTQDPALPSRRNTAARYWIPDRNEWTKAGFFDPSRKPGPYWNYAVHSDTLPEASNPSVNLRGANYYADRWATLFPHLTSVGSYTAARSYYGTFDQAGNVQEWIEDGKGDFRHLAGGSLFMPGFSLQRAYSDGEYASKELSSCGLRVARDINLAAPPVPPLPAEHPAAITTGSRERQREPASSNDVWMTFVTVDHAGNVVDPVYQRGQVNYEFEIGKHEITNQQYAEFLNAVAARSDPFELWHPEMAEGALGGISRTGKSGAWQYQAKPDWQRKPVTYISWYDLARFANYCHFGRPRGRDCEIGTTEGDASQGAYDTRAMIDTAYAQQPTRRNVGAKYWIPSDDEWFKAAYFDPEVVGNRTYWDYPVRTSNLPDNDPPPGGRYSANYQLGEHLAVKGPMFLSDVDAYPLATSYFGVQGMAGNVWEWLEDWRSQGDQQGWRGGEWTRGLRGGSFGYTEVGLHASNIDPGSPEHGYYVYGGRLARGVNEQPPLYPQSRPPSWIARFKALPKRWLLGAFVAGVLTGAIALTLLLRLGRRWNARVQRRTAA